MSVSLSTRGRICPSNTGVALATHGRICTRFRPMPLEVSATLECLDDKTATLVAKDCIVATLRKCNG